MDKEKFRLQIAILISSQLQGKTREEQITILTTALIDLAERTMRVE